MTGFLLDTTLTSEQRDYVETARASGDSLLAIINDILDFSKIESDRLELEQAPFDLSAVVETALSLVAAPASAKQLELCCDIAADTPRYLVGDGNRLRQVLANLLSNAVKFTARGEVVLTIDAARLDCKPEPWVTLRCAVRDTGIGIPAAKMAHLFQSFSQLDSSMARRFGGTGLGLAISKQLVELMGGAITVESEGAEGGGATFTIAVPLPVDAARPALLVPPAPENLRGRRVHVAVANGAQRAALLRLLTVWSLAPVALDAWDGWAAAAPPAAAIADYGLLPAGLADAAVPLVVLADFDAPIERSLRGPLSTVLRKPFLPQQLLDALLRVLIQAPAAPREQPAAQWDATLGERHPLRILVAEDNPVNRKVIQAMLRRFGYSADYAANGLEAVASVAAAAAHPYDVVLMDVQMPELDGQQATARIRAGTARRQPYIVAVTANAFEDQRKHYLTAGMDDYISKPIEPVLLAAVLERAWQAVGEGV